MAPGNRPLWWGHLFPVLALLLMLGPLFKSLEGTWLSWPTVLLVNGAAVLLALLTGAVLGVLALLGLTLVKLFLHDLLTIQALYRIGAFLGVAVVPLLASVLYQRFFASARSGAKEKPDRPQPSPPLEGGARSGTGRD